ncbi:two-component system PAS/PAC sensor signal trans duction histidine kinase [Formosa agariphila KMM 3901]|uniref:histidine kinase n=1 Tax=Formosa agariphila (strain DSM 15362 / KCTC 12365 / LMG 23005 / KMM 3901 / M-2Alg 35-1) TaxID=1347342 RepID=T2KN83_FORAG|nr:PAS domain S-box protein [Formosa agariphila]CDF80322.1 two-component system PAS/PAC sensor signal trans duction histidine kinase [Formosa agariphila KMM 3901]
MHTENNDTFFLKGGGEMGELIRAKDWSKTPLGAPSTWPPCLRHAVSIMLHHPFGMYITWGKEYTQIYNDSYRPILGSSKHPKSLGGSSKDTFAEIWPTIGPMFEDVHAGKTVNFSDLMLQLDRNGYMEDCYFNFAYSPIYLESGEVGGVLVTVMETTAKKKAYQELEINKNELEFVIDAAQLGTFDYYALTNTFSCNARLKDWFGLPPEDEIDLDYALTVIHPKDKDRVADAIAKSLQYSSGGIYDIKYSIINPHSKIEMVVHAKGRAWFNDDKIAYRLSGTLENITTQTKANKKNKEMEEHIRTMVLESPIGICVLDAETLESEIVNDSFIEIAGKPREAIIGNFYWDTFKEVRHLYESAMNKVIETGEVFTAPEVELTLMRHGKAEAIHVSFVYAPLKNENNEVVKLAVWVLDNTTQVETFKKVRVSENNLRLMILQAPVAIGIFRGPEYTIEIANKFALELWGRTEDQVIGMPVFEAMPELLSQGIKEYLDDVVKTGKRFATPEMPILLLRQGELKTVYINFSFEALRGEDGEVNGIMAIGYDITQQVDSRQKIEESEQKIRALVDSAPFPIAVYSGEEMRISLANQSIMDIWGKGYDVVGQLYTDILPELKSQKIFEQVKSVYETGIPFHAKNQSVDLLINNQLKRFYFNYSFTPLLDAFGNIYAVMNTAAEVTELNEVKQKIEATLSEIRLFKFMIEKAADPFILMDEEGRFVYLNTIARNKWGYSEDEIKDLKVPDVDVVFLQEKYNEAFKKAQLETIPPFETLHKNKEGTVYPVEINMGSVHFDGKPLLFAIARDITERKKAEQDIIDAFQKVEESEKRFRNTVKQAPIGIAIFRGKDNITEMANDSYLQIIDKTHDQFVGKPLFEILPEVKETIAPIIEDIFKTGEPFYGYEFPANINRFGNIGTCYFNFVYYPLKENNEISGFMVVATEVTATVKSKHLIKENEEKLNLIIDASELGIWDLDLNTKDVIASNRCYEILGIKDCQNPAQNSMIVNMHPDDLIIRQKAFEKAFKTGLLHYQARVLWEDGSIHWMDARGKLFYDENEVPIRMLGTVRDITEERNFQQELLEREEKFRLLADSMPQHIWTADPDGNLNYFNQSVYDFSGLTAKEILKDGWIQIIHPEDREENIKQWTQAITTGEDYLIEHRFRKFTGEYHWQLSRAIPQRDQNGVIKMWVGSSTDIQDQKMFTNKLEKMVQLRTNELSQKNTDLEKMNKELQSFVYISSHDLQEPLRKIQMFSSRILESEYDTLSSSGQRYFSRMQQSAHRMQTLIQDLIAYSRTSAQECTFENVYLLDIIEDTKDVLSEELNKREVIINLNNNPKLKIIPVQFKQVIFNLVSNAIKFSKEQEPTIITINCTEVNGEGLDIEPLLASKSYYQIQFSDNGIGFEQKYSEKIFEVFQRLHSRDEYSGTGIGLAIVKKIIDNHEGYIYAQSELNEGSTFYIFLPVS